MHAVAANPRAVLRRGVGVKKEDGRVFHKPTVDLRPPLQQLEIMKVVLVVLRWRKRQHGEVDLLGPDEHRAHRREPLVHMLQRA